MGKKILVVDDDPDMVYALHLRLEASGYEVVPSHNGEDALKKVVSESPDLILLDNIMPDIDGDEIAKALKGHARTKGIPIVMISGRGQMIYSKKDKKFQWSPNNPMANKIKVTPEAKSDEALAKAYGVDGYISKPFDTEVLLRVVADVIDKRSKSQ